jgi:hypothetical protein
VCNLFQDLERGSFFENAVLRRPEPYGVRPLGGTRHLTAAREGAARMQDGDTVCRDECKEITNLTQAHTRGAPTHARIYHPHATTRSLLTPTLLKREESTHATTLRRLLTTTRSTHPRVPRTTALMQS